MSDGPYGQFAVIPAKRVEVRVVEDEHVSFPAAVRAAKLRWKIEPERLDALRKIYEKAVGRQAEFEQRTGRKRPELLTVRKWALGGAESASFTCGLTPYPDYAAARQLHKVLTPEQMSRLQQAALDGKIPALFMPTIGLNVLATVQNSRNPADGRSALFTTAANPRSPHEGQRHVTAARSLNKGDVSSAHVLFDRAVRNLLRDELGAAINPDQTHFRGLMFQKETGFFGMVGVTHLDVDLQDVIINRTNAPDAWKSTELDPVPYTEGDIANEVVMNPDQVPHKPLATVLAVGGDWTLSLPANTTSLKELTASVVDGASLV